MSPRLTERSDVSLLGELILRSEGLRLRSGRVLSLSKDEGDEGFPLKKIVKEPVTDLLGKLSRLFKETTFNDLKSLNLNKALRLC